MKITQNTIQNNRTNFNGGWYKPHRLTQRGSRPDFDKKTLTRIAKLTTDKIASISVSPSPSSLSYKIRLKDRTKIVFSQNQIYVDNKTDAKGNRFTTFHDLRQDPESGVLANIIDYWIVEPDTNNYTEFCTAFKRLSELFSEVN